MDLTAQKYLFVVTALLSGIACSTVHTKTPEGQDVSMNEREFAAYIERVFRHHNNVVDSLMFSSLRDAEQDRQSASNEILGAEAGMDNACLPLNEVISATASGGKPDFRTKVKLLNAVPECEVATRKVEDLIKAALTNHHLDSDLSSP